MVMTMPAMTNASREAGGGCLQPGLRSLQHHWLPDPEAVDEAMPRVGGVQQFRPLVEGADFYQAVGYLPINGLSLISYVSAALNIVMDHSQSTFLSVCFAGSRQVTTPLGRVCSTPGGALLLPTGPSDITGSSSAVIIPLMPAAIARTAAAMAGQVSNDGSLPPRWSVVFAPQALNTHQAGPIHSLLHHIDACAAVDPSLPAQLGLDDVIHRMAAMLLDPSLRIDEPKDLQRCHERSGRNAFDALLDYIRANLDQPLRLSDLEARSHYSRRALQYAFREKLNTTPMQWIREQRLALAMARLQVSSPHQSVQAIALACGYRAMGQFSVDFKRRYGVRPSEVRRARL